MDTSPKIDLKKNLPKIAQFKPISQELFLYHLESGGQLYYFFVNRECVFWKNVAVPALARFGMFQQWGFEE